MFIYEVSDPIKGKAMSPLKHFVCFLAQCWKAEITVA